MTRNPTAELISVGTELLLGDIVNTDAAFIARRLAALGITCYHQQTVGDNPARLRDSLKLAASRSNFVILTGGLGPTYDDLTKEVAAELLGKALALHEESLRRIEELALRRGFPMTENNRKQAMLPEGCVVFRNDYGTAPGMAIESEDGNLVLILLPGPPRECEPMFVEQVEPYLAKFSDTILFSRVVNIFGMGESKVETVLRELMLTSVNPTIAPYAKDGEVQLRVTASAHTREECERLCDEAIEKIRATAVGEFIYALDSAGLEYALVPELAARGLKIACAESCTGGYVAKRLTNVSGASDVLDGSIVTYANSVKENFLHVSRETLDTHGAVSRECALEMARGVRELFGADIGVSTTGIAGPTGGTPSKPVGTVFVAVSTASGEECRELHIPGATREYVRYLSASHALRLALGSLCR